MCINLCGVRCFVAKQALAVLERREAQLRAELSAGSLREVDAVQTDLRSVKQQIAALRRQHRLNYFYFF